MPHKPGQLRNTPEPWPPRANRLITCTYSEIMWLLMGRIAPTRANARQLTGLPNTYVHDAPVFGSVDPHDVVIVQVLEPRPVARFSVFPVAVALGVPIYSNAAGVIPIVYALMEKGLSMGTVLAFMMAVTALSLPELIILRKVLKVPLLAVFVGIMTVTIIGVGYLFNAIL